MNSNKKQEAARKRVSELIERFKRNEDDHLCASYNETQVRTEFITPLVEAPLNGTIFLLEPKASNMRTG